VRAPCDTETSCERNSEREGDEAANATLYSSEDGVEGFKAFAAKRKPVWTGR
jgi:enoyl-CoA hydratase/carnithine racemase